VSAKAIAIFTTEELTRTLDNEKRLPNFFSQLHPHFLEIANLFLDWSVRPVLAISTELETGFSASDDLESPDQVACLISAYFAELNGSARYVPWWWTSGRYAGTRC